MGKETISIALILCSILAFSSFATAKPNLLRSLCEPTSNNSNNTAVMIISETPFEKTLKTLLNSLTANAAPKGFFFDTSAGESSDDRANGQALCRGDVGPEQCRNCLEQASREIAAGRRNCSSEEAIVWFDECQVRYSSREFSGVMTYSGKVPDQRLYRRNNVSSPEKECFGRVLAGLIEKLVERGELGDPTVMFATGEARYFSGKNGIIYGLVQCTRDIDGKDCKTCLRSAWGDLRERSAHKEGGVLLSANCNIRFEIFPFYTQITSSKGRKWVKRKVVVVAFGASSVLTILVCILIVYIHSRKGSQQDQEEKSQTALIHSWLNPKSIARKAGEGDELTSTDELPVIDLATLISATDNFAYSNKLGHGGFGTVYKGILQDGKEVAVKRLSRNSWQGLEEFKNEAVLIAKLQHRNLVRLLGFAVEGEEKLLVYEFMPNKSLDSFIFDSEKRSVLDWEIRFNITCGIARGLLYLHEDSRLKIVHRDLKPSNVLLDCDMVAKISDFGLARIFSEDQLSAETKNIAGTYGYMAPEYAMEGQFSVKSDVFSFGVILLEIISGKRNNSLETSQTFIRYAWQLWSEGKELEFVDPMLIESGPTEEAVRCFHIGLLCVQADPADRPTMSSVVVLLESGLVSLPKPSRPAFCVTRVTPVSQSSLSNNFSNISYRSCKL